MRIELKNINEQESLVQYYPFRRKIGYALIVNGATDIQNFYEYVNASDYNHESIIFELNFDYRDTSLYEEYCLEGFLRDILKDNI